MKLSRKPSRVLVLTMVLLFAMVTSAMALTDHVFNYTITAVGTQDITTYPDQVRSSSRLIKSSFEKMFKARESGGDRTVSG